MFLQEFSNTIQNFLVDAATYIAWLTAAINDVIAAFTAAFGL